MKNDKPLRYELIGASAQMIEDYIDRAKPTLCSEPTTAVFPKMNGATRIPGDLSHQIKRHCFQETGLTVNAHLFRSLASKIHNLVHAGDAATISHVLGDKIGTVMRAYIPSATALDELAGLNGCGGPQHGDQFAMTANLDTEDAKPGLWAMESYTFDQP